jgi:hypothetical protein
MTGDRTGRDGRDDCPRTRGLIDQLVAGSPNDEDRRHAPTCPSCGPVLARAERFDDELRRTARRLVAEDLPRGILDPRLTGIDGAARGRGPLPGFATALAAVAIAIVAVAVGLQPPRPGGSESQPPLQIEAPPSSLPSKPAGSEKPESLLAFSSSISRRLKDLGFSCGGSQAPTAEPRPSAVARENGCTGPVASPPNTATVTVGSASSGDVLAVTITAEVSGADDPESRGNLATSLSQLVELVFRSESAATDAGAFVIAQLPGLAASAPTAGLDLDGVRVSLERLDTGVYVVTVTLAA